MLLFRTDSSNLSDGISAIDLSSASSVIAFRPALRTVQALPSQSSASPARSSGFGLRGNRAFMLLACDGLSSQTVTFSGSGSSAAKRSTKISPVAIKE